MSIELVEIPTEEIQEIETVEKPTQETEGPETPEEEPTETVSVEDIVSGNTPAKKSVDKTPKWAKDRFDELTAEKYKLQNRIKELEEQKVISSDRPIPPVESDFMEPQEYRTARIKYEDDVDVWKSHQRKTQEFIEIQEQERTENTVKFNENAKRMREKYADFDQTINEPFFTPEMRDEIKASEFGPEIGYFLAKNPTEAIRFERLSPRALAKEVGKLEVKFSLATKKLISGAPQPLNPLKGDDVAKKDPSKMTDEEWFKWNKDRKLKMMQSVK